MALQPRELRTIRWAAWVSALALALAFVVVPTARRFVLREQLIDARRMEVARLHALIRDESTLRRQVAERAARARSAPRRVLTARNASLAAAALQSTLRGLAEVAPLSVSSLDVSGEPDSTSSNVLPATLSALGDVQALSAFLTSLRHGPFIMNVTELRVRPNSALRGQPLQLSLSVRAPWVDGESADERGSEHGEIDAASERLASTIASSNIFSDARRASPVRYDAAEGTRTEPAAHDSASASPAPAPERAEADRFMPLLFGILDEAGGAVALLRLDPGIPGARPYRLGDQGGRFRVARIRADEVVLDGPGGRRTLHLANPRPERKLP